MQARACFWHTVIGMGCEFPSLARRTLHLENGVQVALLHDPQATRIALAGSLAAGSFHEPAGWPGLAHFVEHALFLGSHGRPGASDFADYVHAHGGRYNARTLALQTLYLLEMPAASGRRRSLRWTICCSARCSAANACCASVRSCTPSIWRVAPMARSRCRAPSPSSCIPGIRCRASMPARRIPCSRRARSS